MQKMSENTNSEIHNGMNGITVAGRGCIFVTVSLLILDLFESQCHPYIYHSTPQISQWAYNLDAKIWGWAILLNIKLA